MRREPLTDVEKKLNEIWRDHKSHPHWKWTDLRGVLTDLVRDEVNKAYRKGVTDKGNEFRQELQQFANFQEWVHYAPNVLTDHPEYAENKPYNNAVCVDAKGRICRIGRDFIRARDENTFPIRWWWPDQPIKELVNLSE